LQKSRIDEAAKPCVGIERRTSLKKHAIPWTQKSGRASQEVLGIRGQNHRPGETEECFEILIGASFQWLKDADRRCQIQVAKAKAENQGQGQGHFEVPEHFEKFGKFKSLEFLKIQPWEAARENQGSRPRSRQREAGLSKAQCQVSLSHRLHSLRRANKNIMGEFSLAVSQHSYAKVLPLQRPFLDWYSKLSLAETSFFARVATPVQQFQMQIEVEPSVAWVCGLGPKYIPQQSFGPADYTKLRLSLADVKRKVCNWTFFNRAPKISVWEDTTSDRILPEAKSKSTWCAPMVYPYVLDKYKVFEKMVLCKAAKLVTQSKSNQCNFLYSLGVKALKKLNADSDVCLNIADKGYGFALSQAELTQKHFEKLVDEGKLIPASVGDFLFQTWEVSHFVEFRLQKALRDGLISRKTCSSLMPLQGLGLRSSDGAAVASSLAGSIRLMPKLHKQAAEVRQVENDSQNVLKPIAKWIAAILNALQKKFCWTTVDSSRDVVKTLNTLQVECTGSEQVWLLSSDIVEFFGNIVVNRDLPLVSAFVYQHLPAKEADLVVTFMAIILRHKYFCIFHRGSFSFMQKTYSLSIGELIATSFANILRHVRMQQVVQDPRVVAHWGYVDDALTICKCTGPGLHEFIQLLNGAIQPLKWKHACDTQQQSFLDIQMQAVVTDGGNFVHFETSMFRKPSFRPHFLPASSMHPPGFKTGISRGETNRALMLCSTSSEFHKCMHALKSFLGNAGYPAYLCKEPAYDQVSRARIFQPKAPRP